MVNSNNESLDRSQLVKGVLDLAVLSVLSNEDGYGYDVVRRLRSAGLEHRGRTSWHELPVQPRRPP